MNSPKVNVVVSTKQKAGWSPIKNDNVSVDLVIGTVLKVSGNDSIGSMETLELMDKLRNGAKFVFDVYINAVKTRFTVSPLSEFVDQY